MTTYTGIGSRETPGPALNLMFQIGVRLAHLGWTLRSGGADGADTAFERGASHGGGDMEIFLPWRGFNGRTRGKLGSPEKQAEAEIIAARFHPAWHRCSQGARRLHTRNVFQVLGSDLNSPSACVICWTVGGEGGGGTGQALRIARHYEVPILDLGGLNTCAVPVRWVTDHLRHRFGIEGAHQPTDDDCTHGNTFTCPHCDC